MAVELTAPAGEQTRARYPDQSGYVEREGVRLHWELYGTGGPTVFLLPTWSIIHSRPRSPRRSAARSTTGRSRDGAARAARLIADLL